MATLSSELLSKLEEIALREAMSVDQFLDQVLAVYADQKSKDVVEDQKNALARAQSAAAYEEERFHTLIDYSPIATIVVDRSGQWIYANHGAEALFHLDHGTLLTRAYNSPEWEIRDLQGNLIPDEKLPFRQVLDTQMPVLNFEHTIAWPDGERVIISVNGAPILNQAGDIQEIIFLMQDVTLQKLHEEELRAQLEKEQQLSEIKSHYLSQVAHEFRTPLSVILTSTELLWKHWDKHDTRQRANRVGRINDQIKRLSKMLNDVTSAYKGQVAHHTLQVAPIALEWLVSRCVEDVRTALNSERVVDVKLNGLCSSFSGDAELLQLIIMNLVSNAVKYSPPSTPVTALFDCQPDYLIITIIDQGIGISAEDQERLFTLFFRGSNVGEIPGMGLGMVVVKQAVDAHHGEIQLDSQQGVGTRFVVKLPHLTAPVGSELDIEKM